MRTRRFRPSVLTLAFGLLCTLIAEPAFAAEGGLVEALYAPYLAPGLGGFRRLGKVDIRTGDVTEIIPDFGPGYDFPNDPVLVASAAFDVDGTLYTIVNTLKLGEQESVSSQLAIIDIDTGSIRLIGDPNPVNLIGLEIDAQGRIYATGFDLPPAIVGDDHLYTIDKETGQAVDMGPTGIDRIMDLAFDGAGTLYATSGNMLYTIDPANGQVLSTVEITGVPEQWFDDPEGGGRKLQPSEVMTIAFDKHGTLHALSMKAFSYPRLEVNGAPHGAPLLRIDPNTGKVTVVAWTGAPNFHSGDIPPAQTVTAVQEEHAASRPKSFVLEQNYPNPFNSQTMIRFALPEREEVELAVYNLMGQKVRTLIGGVRKAGTYTVRWDGRDESGRGLASGVYLYRLQAGTKVKTHKLLLLQ